MSRTLMASSAVAGALIAAGLIGAPFGLKPYGIYILSLWAVTTIAAIGLNLTLGYAGQLSLAQGAFVGIGAYVTALITVKGCRSVSHTWSPGSPASASAGCSAIRRCACSTIISPS